MGYRSLAALKELNVLTQEGKRICKEHMTFQNLSEMALFMESSKRWELKYENCFSL